VPDVFFEHRDHCSDDRNPQQQAPVLAHPTAQGFGELCTGGVNRGMDLVGEAFGVALTIGPRRV
jgi:hypothetical protein